MRLQALTEHVSALLLLVFVSWCCFDEEPVLDLTDLNALHVWFLVLCVCVVLFEPTLRGRSGQFLYKDITTLVAVLTF